MSDIQRLFSPDARFFVLLESYEIRMSHWITSAALWETAPERVILRLGASLWSTERVIWSDDSTCASVTLRRYPGDAPALVIDMYPDRRSIKPHVPTDAAPIPFEGLDQLLEEYYQQHRRRSET